MRKIDEETRSRRMALNLTPSLDAQIRAVAKLRGISATELIIRILRAELDKLSDEEKIAVDAMISARKKYEVAVDHYLAAEQSVKAAYAKQMSLFDYGANDGE